MWQLYALLGRAGIREMSSPFGEPGSDLVSDVCILHASWSRDVLIIIKQQDEISMTFSFASPRLLCRESAIQLFLGTS